MGIGLPELLIIFAIILLVFGAGKLPQVMGQLGKGVNAFKEGASEAPWGTVQKGVAPAASRKVVAAKPTKKVTAKIAKEKPAAKAPSKKVVKVAAKAKPVAKGKKASSRSKA